MMRKGFSLLYALIFIIMVSMIVSAIISIQQKAVFQTQDVYLDIASDNALKNLTEYSIMAIQGHDFKKGCINKINYDIPLFKGTATFHYFLTDCTGCTNCSVITTKETNGTVLIDAVIESKNPDLFIRKERITLQNP